MEVITKKRKILIIGVTGYVGRHLVEASLSLGYPTFALVRESTMANHPEKAQFIQGLKDSGVTILFGDLYDYESLVKAIKQVDVVFSLMGHHSAKQLEDQINIVSAIKAAGNIKRFFPSEFGFDVDRLKIMEPAKSALAIKARIRKEIRNAGIPFTFISCNFFATYFLSRLCQVEATGIPEQELFILGDGNTQVIFNSEKDIAMYAIRAVDDPRTLNKILYVRPKANHCSVNELVSLWEKKANKTLKRIFVPEEEVLEKIQSSPEALAFFYAVAHAGFIKGETCNFDVDPSLGVEATDLYADLKYITVEQMLNKYI
ncbi:hypothetical protein J5N97_024931 [Dioscorea zingiberensis]|uniref:NmrA-like domain-containing protein n=1 Tax=Dioscorea zingiberensis TaxID=325984 RepID=A0A9D5H969_9LILI|nr:hypothetical protein J5N97_024931 [Dioscorea zingiberensis]